MNGAANTKVPPSAAAAASHSSWTIKFIRADDGSIVGMLDRYWDPDRQCYAISVFRGHIGKGIVEGTFLTTFGSGAGEATGTWHASKQPPSRR